MRLIARHGDVYIFAVSRGEVPETAKKTKSRVLAEGEVTGHAHRLTGKVDVFEDTDGTLYFVPLEGGASTIHEEHTEIPIVTEEDEVGTNRIQREYNHYEKAAQRVRD